MQLNLKITGCVQGVFFRAEACGTARGLGLTGWVRNVSGGSVEVLAQGPQDKLKILAAWCERGPDRAHVENVHAEWSEEKEALSGFEIY